MFCPRLRRQCRQHVGRFPSFLIAEAALASWDVLRHRLLDEPRTSTWPGVWSADPDDHHARWSHRDGRRCAAHRCVTNPSPSWLTAWAACSSSVRCFRMARCGNACRTSCSSARRATVSKRHRHSISGSGRSATWRLGSPFITTLRSDWTTTIGLHAPVHVRDRRRRSRRIRPANLIDRTVPRTAPPCGVREPPRES